jgi:hypothetical protein
VLRACGTVLRQDEKRGAFGRDRPSSCNAQGRNCWVIGIFGSLRPCPREYSLVGVTSKHAIKLVRRSFDALGSGHTYAKVLKMVLMTQAITSGRPANYPASLALLNAGLIKLM